MGSASRKNNNKQKYIIAAGAAAVLVAVLVLFFTGEEPVYSFEELSPIDAGGVQLLAIRDGTTGEQVQVDEPEVSEAAADFWEIMAPLTFKQEDAEPKPGWAYTVELFRDEENYLQAVFAGQSVKFAYHEDGQKEWERSYSADQDVAPQLEGLYAQVREIQEEKEEPTEVAVQRIDPAISVVINNHPSSRPSSGLQMADFVYEFLVEGGATRYLVVFSTYYDESFDIGPIRSLRPYFGVQAQEHGGIIAHSGYSARTRQMIQGLGLYQIGDYGDNFWRDRSRRSPHNLYTSIDLLYGIVDDRIEVEEKVFRLDYELPGQGGEGETIEIEHAPGNKVQYTYDEEREVYLRSINGRPHTDRETGEQYFADRVIIRETPHSNVPGPEGLVNIELRGSGPGILYEKGRSYPVSWERNGQETVYRFENGEEVPPIHGTTWIQVVRR